MNLQARQERPQSSSLISNKSQYQSIHLISKVLIGLSFSPQGEPEPESIPAAPATEFSPKLRRRVGCVPALTGQFQAHCRHRRRSTARHATAAKRVLYALAESEELTWASCEVCGAFTVGDRFSFQARQCLHCTRSSD
jgi:hypothetical protein